MRTILEATPLAFCLWALCHWPADAAEVIPVKDAQHAMWSATILALIAVATVAWARRARP
jgi:hypothetical protein